MLDLSNAPLTIHVTNKWIFEMETKLRLLPLAKNIYYVTPTFDHLSWFDKQKSHLIIFWGLLYGP